MAPRQYGIDTFPGWLSGSVFGWFPISLMLAMAVQLAACHKKGASPTPQTRSYRMGFGNSGPRPVFSDIIRSLNTWTTHADAAIVSTEVPWDSLLNGANPVTLVSNSYSNLVSIYRSANLKLWVYIDPENGLDRRSDSRPLVARKMSIAQPAMQQIYRRFVVVMDSLLHPDHLGLALETNLIRAAAPDSIYQGVKKAVNAAAADVRVIDPHVPLSVSVQAETAWGHLGGSSSYVGVSTDFADFPFLQELGISSYPYLGYSSPADLPQNYYSQLVTGHSIPVFVSEGGWTSVNLPAFSVQSSPTQQQAYIRRQAQLLTNANAICLFQLTFTDLSLSAWGGADSASLVPFAFLGMVDTSLNPKPAFAIWDSLRGLPLQSGH